MDALSFDFMQRALVACLLVGATAPLVGAFIVQRQQSLVGDGLGHVAFAGVGLAFLAGWHPLVGALALTLLAALALHRLRSSGLSGDLSLALIFYGGIALGFLLSQYAGTSGGRLTAFLFGSPLTLTWAQIGVIAALCLFVALTVAALYGPLVAVAFDEAAARVGGVPVGGLLLALTLLVALIVVGGMSAVGILLIAALMVLPVGGASTVARSYRGTVLVASGIGAFSSIVGLIVAYHADLAPGAAIVLAVIGCHLLALAARRLRLVQAG